MDCRTKLTSWNNLVKHQREIADISMQDLFSMDCHRFRQFSIEWNDLLVDFSKNRITTETIELFSQLADQVDLSKKIDLLFSGASINFTEKRPVLHTALRNRSTKPIYVDDQDVMVQIRTVLKRMEEFSTAIRNGSRSGSTGKPFKNIVTVGIGGSVLGTELVMRALEGQIRSDLKTYFISGIDPVELKQRLLQLDVETTLFVIVSKSFTTAETMMNACAARSWVVDSLGASAVADHFVAVAADGFDQRRSVRDFGIDDDQYFPLWDWVGGRYSLWSAVGLPIALSMGMETFEGLLEGAYSMDQHFRTADWNENIPVLLAMIGVWYNNFFGAQSYAVLPYDPALEFLPAYLQQLDMESNGKSSTRDGKTLNYSTGPVLWGGLGMNGQHAFYQHLHQGTTLVPSDFLCAIQSSEPSYPEHHRCLLASCLAQSTALMEGNSKEKGSYDAFTGNRPSNTILYPQMTPKVLGSLLALYEHRTFVQGVIWNVNSFDQWGVELGKAVTQNISAELLMPLMKTQGAEENVGNIVEYCRAFTAVQ